MPRLPFGRILLLAPLALLAASAAALNLNIESTGKGAVLTDLGNGESMLTADETTFTTQSTTPTSAAFTDAYFGLTKIAGKTEATLAYRDDQPSNTLNLAFEVVSDTTSNGVRTISGNWRYVSGTGDYSDYSTDTSKGNWTFRWTTADGSTGMNVQGELNDQGQKPTVPGYTALALGVPALIRRKQR